MLEMLSNGRLKQQKMCNDNHKNNIALLDLTGISVPGMLHVVMT